METSREIGINSFILNASVFESAGICAHIAILGCYKCTLFCPPWIVIAVNHTLLINQRFLLQSGKITKIWEHMKLVRGVFK